MGDEKEIARLEQEIELASSKMEVDDKEGDSSQYYQANTRRKWHMEIDFIFNYLFY